MHARKLQIAVAFAISLFAASTTAALAQSCKDEAGAEEAQTYVDHCIEVSPATRPPCNAGNPCDLIISEIVRGCEMLGNDAPQFCGDYGG